MWLDLGSGGGSPAIPLKVVRSKLKLTMVESKVRKAAFLREAIRTMNLSDAAVENTRMESLGSTSTWRSSAWLITVRAIRAEPKLFALAAELLASNGRLLLFRPTNATLTMRGFEQVETVQLTDVPRAFLAVFRRVFHVEQSR